MFTIRFPIVNTFKLHQEPDKKIQFSLLKEVGKDGGKNEAEHCAVFDV